ncbi:hypothetical protein FE257_000021 [Aspergillus nanangensis]|uniref:Uncharacterized protein n=1 Tax=Aspergillus nanangensis TaxID=2582783 RepID=A0AAD4CYQ1_ASPNN|nr:hypothetical protein FE257_000021 [Aspergillus nanangensis]
MLTDHHYSLTGQEEVSDDTRGNDPFKPDPQVQYLDSEQKTPSSKWTIGWITPSGIVTGFLLAAVIAGIHLGIFYWLNEQDVDKKINQAYVTALSFVLVNAFRLCLASAVGIAFAQLLWKDLRVRAMRIDDIDSLSSILSNPLYLGSARLLFQSPLPFLCALFCWCIPIAMIFPPGSMTVEPRTRMVKANATVPSFDPSFFGNGTRESMWENAFWQPDAFDAYSGPTVQVNRIAKQVIIGGNYLTSTSPCGQNCTYAIDIIGPSWKCTDEDEPELFSWVNKTYPQATTGIPYIYLAYPDYALRVNQSNPLFNFHLRWQQGEGKSASYQNLSCIAYESSYALNITYSNGQQTVDSKVKALHPLNATYIYWDNAVDPNTLDPVIDATTVSDMGNLVVEAYTRANLAGIQDSLAVALEGYIDMFIMHSQETANTIINLSNLYSGPVTKPKFDISTDSLQSLLQNITISMLTVKQTTVRTVVTKTINVNVYAFQHPVRLIVPYFLSLLLAAVFALAGGFALMRNGISANTGGVFQTLCTTAGSTRLRELAAKGSLGGRENIPEELKDLKVMFGVLKQSEHGRMAGLGTVDEVTPLLKGSI